MNILIVGGGPGGLYVALLLKKTHPDYDIRIVERNPDGATYGWGVVFSDRTLASFREADFPTYQAIVDSFTYWTAIDTFYRDALIRSEGHSFAGLSRRQLLRILQDRCLELGVPIAYDTDLAPDDFGQFADYDLVIAADGVNSLIRETYAEYFLPDKKVGRAKFAWFGTDKTFDSFTFIFRENEHGLFQVHAYPFDGTTSTFIVETDEAVWRRAGLDKLDEQESLAYCQALFADDLGNSKLLSNRSLWTNFLRVKNKVWHHENVVLLGDSAHTAHFSIGSGTKLAMESAIALANGLEQHGDNLQAAFNEYEMDRQPRVERLQQVAEQSQTYFEDIKRYLHLEPLQFTFQLLTRSGRITYDSLRVRDPYLVDKVDRWFSHVDARAEAPLIAAPPVFTPLKIGGLAFGNRIAAQPAPAHNAQDGTLDAAQAAVMTTLARRGASLVLSHVTAVSAGGRITPGDAGLYSEEHLDVWQATVKQIHASTGAKVGLRLNHAGRRGSTLPPVRGLDVPLAPAEAWPLLAPSPLPYAPGNQTPQQMDRAAMERVRDEFVRAAEMALAADFDVLHLHFAHGYLLASFLSPLTNQRNDDYGKNLEGRLKYPLEVLAAVRQKWPANKVLSVAIPATDAAPGGLSPADGVRIAQALKDNGCDMVEVLAGYTTPTLRAPFGPAFLTPLSDIIRQETNLPALVGGHITTSGQANTILAAGQADMCIVTPT